MKLLYKWICGFFVVVLSGCTVIPGSHVDLDVTNKGREEMSAWRDRVGIRAITPQVIAQLATSGPQKQVASGSAQKQFGKYEYVVGPGDVLNVTVWDHPELTIPAGGGRSAQESGNWVHDDGTIFYPYIGVVAVAGLGVTEIREKIRKRLSDFIHKPQVDVTVAAFRSKKVFVTGEVRQPGPQALTNVPLSLVEAVSQAGGLTPEADWTSVALTREGRTTKHSLKEIYQEGNLSGNLLLRSQDVLHVARNDSAKIFVLGEVIRPQTVTIGRGELTLAEALTESGGFSQATADASGIFVMREGGPGSGLSVEIFQLNAQDATALVLADQFRLKKRDIVYVTAAPIARWNRIIEQLLPTAQAVYLFGRAEGEVTDRP